MAQPSLGVIGVGVNASVAARSHAALVFRMLLEVGRGKGECKEIATIDSEPVVRED